METTTNAQAPVAGPVRVWLRLEGLFVVVISLAIYVKAGGTWGRFFALILVPDLSLLGYLAGPYAGAWTYNTVHSALGPLLLGAACATGLLPMTLLPYAAIWAAHVGMDRAFGYGLKYPTAFRHTHLSRIGA